MEPLARRIHPRVLRHLKQQGLLSDDSPLFPAQDKHQKSMLPLFQAASIRGQCTNGPAPTASAELVLHLVPENQQIRPPTLCAEFDGFSLHAVTRIAADDRITSERQYRLISAHHSLAKA